MILARENILLEELILVLGVLLSVLLERLVFDQTHVGTKISFFHFFYEDGEGTNGSIIKDLVVASVYCLGPAHFFHSQRSSHLNY
jgi:hypothetical protein